MTLMGAVGMAKRSTVGSMATIKCSIISKLYESNEGFTKRKKRDAVKREKGEAI